MNRPTDAELDAALRKAGFTHCFDKPYPWAVPAAPPRPPAVLFARVLPPSVKPSVRRWPKRKGIA